MVVILLEPGTLNSFIAVATIGQVGETSTSTLTALVDGLITETSKVF